MYLARNDPWVHKRSYKKKRVAAQHKVHLKDQNVPVTSSDEKLQSRTLTGIEVLRESTVGTKMRKKVSIAISGLLLS